jgi:thymidylate synthase
MEYEFRGINSFLVGMSKELLKHGIERKTRNYTCFEMPYPVMIKITDPTSRLVTVEERGWNLSLGYAESLWLALGQNNVEFVGHYVNNLYTFSDDGKFMRAGYGPRLRHFSGVAEDYKIGDNYNKKFVNSESLVEVDQFEFVELSFKRDAYTRQGIITVEDPAKDCFEHNYQIKTTKDFPCTKSLHFQRNRDKLDLIVNMRSNDFIWGAGGVNIFNFTFIQEYFAQIVGLEIGAYYHVVDNLHYYENHRERLERMASCDNHMDEGFVYKKSFASLKEFDTQIKDLSIAEKQWREGSSKELIQLNDDFFNDWAKVLFSKNVISGSPIEFANPLLNELHNRRILKRRSQKSSQEAN